MQKQKHAHSSTAPLQECVNKFLSKTQESRYCECKICQEKYQLLQKGKQILRASSTMFKLQSNTIRKFYELLSNVDNKINFKMQIPEICFFEKGEAKYLFKTKSGFINTIIMNQQTRKNLGNYFADSKKSLAGPMIIDVHTGAHIKYLDELIPSIKVGLDDDNLSNKPQSYKFHNDKRLDNNEQVQKSLQSSNKDIVIVKYKDKAFQLLNQKKLRELLRSNFKTQHIEFIQSYIEPHFKESEYIFSQYNKYKSIQNELMYNRSSVHIKIQSNLMSKFSKEYISIESLQEYERVLKDISQQYCLYQTYKMVHYLEINRQLNLKELTTVWFKDQFKQLTFFGVMNLKYDEKEEVKADVSQITQLNDLMKTDLTELEKELLNAWQNMKKRKISFSRKEVIINEQQQREINEIKEISEIRRSNRKS